MQEAEIGLTIHIAVTVLVSIISHFLRRDYVLTCIYASLIANVIFQIVVSSIYGLDKFALVAFLVGGLYSFIMALVIGIPFLVMRRRKAKELVKGPGVLP